MTNGGSHIKIKDGLPSNGKGNGNNDGNGKKRTTPNPVVENPEEVKQGVAPSPADQPKKRVNTKPAQCDICGTLLSNKKSLKQHVARVHENRCIHCYEKFSTRDLVNQHEKSQVLESRKKCSKCDLEFKYDCTYQKHVASNICKKKEDKEGECRYCGKRFSQKKYRFKHEKALHKGMKICTTCNEIIIEEHYNEHVATHMADNANVHLQVFVEKTSQARPTSTTTHSGATQSEVVEEGDQSKKKTNESEKPTKLFKCAICGKAYRSNSGLSYHKSHEHLNRCTHCRETFSTPDLLGQHQSRNFISRQKCSKCNLEFTYNCAYKKHVNLRICEDELGKFQCRYCDKVFYRKHFVFEHEKVEHQGLTRCHTCNKVMAVGDYDQHEKKHAAGNIRQYVNKKKSQAPSTCTSTSTRAKSEDVKKEDEPPPPIQSTETKIQQPRNPYFCEICGELIPSIIFLMMHIECEHKAYTCSKCGETFQDSASYERHLRSNDCRTFKCECGKEFSSKKLLETHIKSESLQSNLNCSICNKDYWYRCTFEQHVRSNNCKKKPSNCQHCGENFNTPELLNLHLESQVLNTPGICSNCGEQFQYYCAYEKHVRSNNCGKKQRRVQCGTCAQEFLNISELQIHEENSHKDPSPMLCLLCNMTIDFNLFNDHLESCQKKFLGQLTSTFTNIETPKFEEENHYECSKCPEKFPTQSSLQGHLESAHRSPKGATLAVGKMEVKQISGEKRKGSQHERPQSATKRWRYVTPTSGPASASTTGRLSVSRTGPVMTPPTRQPFPFNISTEDAKKIREHLHETTYVCDYPHCSQPFNSLPAFMDHVGKEHPGFKPFQCVICFKDFATMSKLHQHYNNIHFYIW